MPSAVMLLTDAAGLLVIAWLFNLVRRDRLYVGYGVIFVFVIATGLVVLSVPPALAATNGIGALLSQASGLVVLALAFVLLMLVYILSQVTLLSNRVARLTQEIAIRGAQAEDRVEAAPARSRREI
jgi:hypothetical protein